MEIDSDAKDDCIGIEDTFSALSIHMNSAPQLNQLISMSPNLPEDLQVALTKLSLNNYEENLIGLKDIRTILSAVDCTRIVEIVNLNISPTLISMAYSRPKEFALEVCWVLCNIATGPSECTQYLININSLQFFSQVFELDINSFDLQDQIVWAIGNIAGESNYFRDIVLNSEIFSKILRYSQILPPSITQKYENLIWTASNFLRGKSRPPPECVSPLEIFLLKALLQTNSEDSLKDILDGLGYASANTKNVNLYTQDIMQKVIQLCKHNLLAIHLASLKILGNFIAHCENSWLILCNLDVISTVMLMISSNKHSARREALFVCSLLCAESQQVIDALINGNFFSSALAMVDEEDYEIVKEIIIAVETALNNCTTAQAMVFFNNGWIQRLMQLFPRVPEESKRLILVGLNSLFTAYPAGLSSQFRKEIEEFTESSEISEEVLILVQNLLSNV